MRMSPHNQLGNEHLVGPINAAPLIRFTRVSKAFTVGESVVQAVMDLNLSVMRGEFITLVGPSGCGKSTLLNMVAGLMKPSEGNIEYGGEPVTGINRRVGYMTQADHLLPWRTIAGNISVPLEIRRIGKQQRKSRIQELINLVGLTGFDASYPSQVSGGMRKRAALARLLASDPETLLMDEPFGALDAQLRLAMQTELLTVQTRLHKTVIFVTHDLDEAISLADRCVVFSRRPGRILQVIETGLPRGRDLLKLRFDPTFLKLAHGLWEKLSPDIKSEAFPT